MKVIFLESARNDIVWFRAYYRSIFPAGKDSAKARYQGAKEALKSNPRIGHPLDSGDLRALVMPRTPFAFIYRIRNDQIQVVRLLDGRADRPTEWM